MMSSSMLFDGGTSRESNHGRTLLQFEALTCWRVAGLMAGSRVLALDCVEAAKLRGRCSLQAAGSKSTPPSKSMHFDGGVHFDTAAGNEHLPLSSAASVQSQARTRLPAISPATPHHVSASTGRRVCARGRPLAAASRGASLLMVACTSILLLATSTSR